MCKYERSLIVTKPKIIITRLTAVLMQGLSRALKSWGPDSMKGSMKKIQKIKVRERNQAELLCAAYLSGRG